MKFLESLTRIALVGASLSLASTPTLAEYKPQTGDQEKTTPQNKKKYSDDTVLIKFKKNVSDQAIQDTIHKSGAVKVKHFQKMKDSTSDNITYWRHLTLPKGVDVATFIKNIAKNPHIEIAEPNYIYSTTALPNDPYIDKLWGMHNTTKDVDIDAPEAWAKFTGSKDIVVGVIDTGIDYNHEDLAANMWKNPGEIPNNGIDDDNNGYIDDVYGANFITQSGNPFDDDGHGTHCAGTIGAVGNNGIGVAGVSWNVKLMALKFLDNHGSGTAGDAIEAIRYALNKGVKILSNSWGGFPPSQALKDAIIDAQNANALFLAAAGNDTNNNDGSMPMYPASYDTANIISVAATNSDDQLASFSNYGATSVDLGAPGVDIYSTVPMGTCVGLQCLGTSYDRYQGTSMATPHVAGAAALALGLAPSMPIDVLKTRILATTDPVANLTGKVASGGRLNIQKLLGSSKFKEIPSTYKPRAGRNSTTSYTLSLSGLGSSQTVSLTLEGLATGITGSISNPTISIPTAGTASTTITLNTSANIANGSYPIRVAIREASGETSYSIVLLDVYGPEAKLTMSPEKAYTTRNSTVTYNLNLASTEAFSGYVDLTASSSEPTVSTTLSNSRVYVPQNGSVALTLNATTTSLTPIAVANINISYKGGPVTKTKTATLGVSNVDFQPLSVAPAINKLYLNTENGNAVAVQVRNNGTGWASGSARFCLAETSDVTIYDCVNGFPISLNPGETDSHTEKFYLSGWTPGNYYLGLITDPFDAVLESNESNNRVVATGLYEVKYDIDLQPTAIRPLSTSWTGGNSSSINYSIRNNGLSSFNDTQGLTNVKFYLSTDTNITTSDYLIGSRSLSGVTYAQYTADYSTSFSTSNVPAGNYYLGVIASTTFGPESDLTNNTLIYKENNSPVVINVSTSGTSNPPPSSTGTALTNGVALNNLAASAYVETAYYIDIPAGATVVVQTSGGTGDADLYGQFGSPASTSSYTCSSLSYTNSETCRYTTTTAGRYYILIRAYQAYSGMQLLATY